MKLLLALLALAAPLLAETPFDKWEKEIAAMEAADKTQPPPKGAVLFTGSSSIRLWKTLAADFPQHNVINHGFGGSQIVDSTHFAERIIFPHEPRMIVLYAGGNDINSGKSAQTVFEDFKAFVAKVRAKMPDVPLAYISIAGNPARWAQVEKVREANRLIAGFAKAEKGITFIDTFTAMLGDDGMPKPDIFVADRLHMNANGYAIWKEVVGKHLPAPDKK